VIDVVAARRLEAVFELGIRLAYATAAARVGSTGIIVAITVTVTVTVTIAVAVAAPSVHDHVAGAVQLVPIWTLRVTRTTCQGESNSHDSE
jgi:hypothetical protein